MALVGVLCLILIGVLVVEKANVPLSETDKTSQDKHTSPYVSSYVTGPTSSNSTIGNLIIVNPTSDFLQNLTIELQIDGSMPIVPSLRLWDSNYNLTTPVSQLESELSNMDLSNYSSPATSINIEPKQKTAVNLNFPSPASFPFNSHALAVYVSQNSFGDVINGTEVTVPQTMAYLQIVSFSSVVTDQNTYHEYYNSTLKDYVYINDNPNFCQRYFNYTWQIYATNYGLAAYMGVLDVTYFNVTIHNNNTFPVNSVTLFEQKPSGGSYPLSWRALTYHVIQPNETYIFPVPVKETPTYSYVTGYLSNSTSPSPNLNSTPSPAK